MAPLKILEFEWLTTNEDSATNETEGQDDELDMGQDEIAREGDDPGLPGSGPEARPDPELVQTLGHQGRDQAREECAGEITLQRANTKPRFHSRAYPANPSAWKARMASICRREARESPRLMLFATIAACPLGELVT